MATTEDLLKGTAEEIITRLTEKGVPVPSWSTLVEDYEPTLHRIVRDATGRRDKTRSDGGIDKASRIHIGLEKLLVSRINEFMFALPVKRIYNNIEGNETRQAIANAIEAIYKNARIDTQNKQRGKGYFAGCEVFTIWYAVESPNTRYGFNSQFKLKCKTYSPMDGAYLFPLFDEFGDMLAMSIRYKRKVKDEEETYFETYTADRHLKWKQGQHSLGWEEQVNERIAIQKIPGVYVWRPQPAWHGLSHIREEIEYTLSRNSDVIAYNSAPILKVTGNLIGQENKGETQRVYRLETGGDISYVSWAQASEALRYQVATLLNLFWTQGQMPDISFDQMKGLGNIGYDARQTVFMDAHLKIGDESGPWIEALERECNVIKAFLKQMNTAWASEVDNVDVEHIITPYIQNDEAAEIDKWVKANGGKPVVSQLESIQNLGISADPVKTMEMINEEAAQAALAQMQSVMGGYQ